MTATKLCLKLLGGIQITAGETPITGFASRKVQALLCYLAVSGRPHTRDSLAGLLWGGMPDADAKTNLRQALANLRKLIGPHLDITRQTVALNPHSNYTLDVGAFTRNLEKIPWQHNSSLTPDLAHSLGKAIDLYQGDFLDGFFAGDALAFEEWMLVRRERLRELALQVLHTLSVYYTRQRQYPLATEYTTRLLALDPWREEAHRQLMLLLVRNGRRNAALKQYQTCCQILSTELGIEPMDETTTLYQRIRAMPASPPLQLPPQPTPFVGRTEELSQIKQLLADPACRLLSLVGPGGVGKTRLALQAAGETGRCFLEGTYFVPLVSIPTPESLAPALAEAVGFTFQEQGDPQEQLLSYLERKEILWVLDNFEHLLGATALLEKILQRAPDVKIMVTSRTRLNTPWEWLFDVAGLAYPASQQQARGKLKTYSAVQLFIQSARRLQPNFALAKTHEPAVTRICQYLSGLPLGIELAASWTRSLSCSEIVDEMERNLDFLTASTPQIEPRHRSARVVLAYSWSLLAADERRILRQLSVFQGGFCREAAVEVVGAADAMLATLIDKSLLRRTPEGRYEMHELWRQFVAEKLAEHPAELDQIRQRHSLYYLHRLQQQMPCLSRRDSDALAAVGLELGNLQAGWRWVTDRDEPDRIEQYVAGLGVFYNCRNRFQEMIDTLEQALAWERQREQTDPAPSDRLRQATWERQLGEAYFRLGRLPASQTHHSRALAILKCPVPATRGQLMWGLTRHLLQQLLHRLWPARFVGRVPKNPPEIVETVRAYERLGQIDFFANRPLPALYDSFYCLNLVEAGPSSPELARYYASLGLTSGFVPLHKLAQLYHRLALQTAQEVNHLPALAWVLELNAIYHNGIGAWEQTKRAAQQAADIAIQLDDRRRWEESVVMLAHTAQFEGDFAASINVWRDIYASAAERGDAQVQVWGLSGQAESMLPLGRIDEAARLLTHALTLPVETADYATDISCYGLLAVARLRQGQYQPALAAAEKAARLATQSSPTAFSAFEGYAGVAEVYLRLWESPAVVNCSAAELKAKSQQACKTLGGFARVFPIARPRAWLCRGLCRWRQGKHRAALKAWRKSLAAAQHLAMPFEETLAHFELGRHLPPSNPSQQAHMSRAETLFIQLEAAYDVAASGSIEKNEA